MSSGGHTGRGRPAAGRGNRPYRGGGFRGGRGNRGGRGGGPGRGRGGFQGGNGRDGHHGGHATPSDPSLDPQLAPRPPHPGYFQTSFVENPWYDLESKLGIEHLKPVVSSNNAQPVQNNTIDAVQEHLEQAAVPSSQPPNQTTT